MFSSIDAAASGIRLGTTWLAKIASNVANDVTPGYRAEVPIAAPRGDGAALSGPATRTGSPNVDLAVEMPNLLMATDYIEANLAVIRRAQDVYRSMIDTFAR
jgi:flagellar basal body rod protein FlgC